MVWTEQSRLRAPRMSWSASPMSVRVNDGIVVIEIVGQIDAATTAECRDELLGLCGVCVGTLIIDMSACVHLSAAAVVLLRAAHQRCQQGRCQIRVRAHHSGVLDALAAAGIPRVEGGPDRGTPPGGRVSRSPRVAGTSMTARSPAVVASGTAQLLGQGVRVPRVAR